VNNYAFEKANLLQRLMRVSAAWKPVSWFYARTLHHIDRAVYKATKGRKTFAALVTGLPVCMLTTTGAKSGQPRTVPLLAIPERGDLIVIGSNYGQKDTPAWCANLRANPEVTMAFEGKRLDMVATEVHGAEREALYNRGIGIYPGWTVYKSRANRTIPVFRLTTTG
jgi:deazaflavin-dependent oxidoreductase (nitroreductase family)